MFDLICVEVIMTAGRINDGVLGEKIAADYLKLRGYEILERNYRARHLEIDLIARDNNCLVFIEVKTRKNFTYGRAIESLPYWKVLNIRKAALNYITKEEKSTGICKFRLDFVAIDVEFSCDKMVLQHLKDVA
ncbi:MAG: YraN family protein [Candidatus Krumholzibacteriota bacterium]|nr:YraN family protein [Candidatus Krumholzibacteriota bacterium]